MIHLPDCREANNVGYPAICGWGILAGNIMISNVADKLISIIIAVFNEAGNIAVLVERIEKALAQYPNYEIMFVDDGSSDDTLTILKLLSQNNKKIKYVSFSRNFGHQAALRAGYDYIHGDCAVCMDGDLQHPPELIPSMIEKWIEGYDIVHTLRKDSQDISLFKRITSHLFYSFVNLFCDVKIEHGSADYRLCNSNVVEVIRNLHENSIVFRMMIRWMGFRQVSIHYNPEKRYSGEPKYSFLKSMKLAISGITSFSTSPLHFSTICGLSILSLSCCYALYALFMQIFAGYPIQSWIIILLAVLLMGSLQLIMLGILGEYVGKLFIESKKRPCYLIKEKNFD